MNNIKNYIEKTYELEDLIINSEYYKNHYKVIKPLLNFGIHIPRVIPFILSSMLVTFSLSINSRDPFILEERLKKANFKTTYYGTDEILDSYSFDETFEDSLKYTTAWKDTKDGLHERIVTTYEVPSHDELLNDKIYTLSKDELDESYNISNVETFIKSVISEDEMRFVHDMAVVEVNNGKSSVDIVLKKQTFMENLFTDVLLYSILTIVVGGFMDYFILEKMKRKMKNHLEIIDERLNLLDLDTLKKLKKDLELRKENLELLEVDEKTLEKRRINN